MITRSDRTKKTRQALPAQSTKEPLQVRIPTAVKRRFKAHAALRGLEPNALFVEVWERYEASLPTAPSAQTET